MFLESRESSRELAYRASGAWFCNRFTVTGLLYRVFDITRAAKGETCCVRQRREV